MSLRVTKPGTRRLSEVARHVVIPDGITATGWGDVERVCAKMGVGFDEWQRGAGRLILARREDGKLATTVGGVGMSLPRQVGKTYLLAGLIFALCALRRKTLVIWSAHHGKTHEETFLAMQGFAERPKVKPYIDRVYTGSGDESVNFNNGSRILFGAREHGFGRGIPGVDVLVFDEAQILSDKAMAAMLATMNTSELGLHLYIGTPPREDELHKAGTFMTMRDEALAGEAEDSVWIECGADPDADSEDRKQWAKANPSFPHRTPIQAFLRLKKRLTDEDFRREGLGIWHERVETDNLAIDLGLWSKRTLKLTHVSPDWPLAAVGLDMDMTGRLWVAVAAHADAPGVHVELLPDDPLDESMDVAVQWLWKRCRRRLPVVMPADSGATMLEAALLAKGMKVYRLNVLEQAQASAGLLQALKDGEMTHLDDPVLEQSVREAPQQKTKQGWRIDRGGELSSAPLLAVTAARFGAVKWSRRRPADSGTSGRVVVL